MGRKGLSCKLINNTNDIFGVHAVFNEFAQSIAKKTKSAKSNGFDDPSYEQTLKVCENICELTKAAADKQNAPKRTNAQVFAVIGAGVFFNHLAVVYTATAFLIGLIAARTFGLSVKTSLKPSQVLLND